jgi:hypothetical protein
MQAPLPIINGKRGIKGRRQPPVEAGRRLSTGPPPAFGGRRPHKGGRRPHITDSQSETLCIGWV